MEAKQVSSLLLFSLLTLVVCNNIKAMKNHQTSEENTKLQAELLRVKKEFKNYQTDHPYNLYDFDEYKSTLIEHEKESTKAKEQLRINHAEVTRLTEVSQDLASWTKGTSKELEEASKELKMSRPLLHQYRKMDAPTALKNKLKYNKREVGLLEQRCKKLQSKNKLLPNKVETKRCMPYGCGTAIAGGTDYLLFCFDETGKRGKSKYFKWLHQSVKDSKTLQIVSLAAADYGDQPHNFLNRGSAGTDSLSDGYRVGAANVTGETVNAVALRWGWNEPTVRHFITEHLKKIDNN